MTYDYENNFYSFPGNILEVQTNQISPQTTPYIQATPYITIGIDIDGVIVNQIQGLLDYLNDLYRSKLNYTFISPEEINEWNLILRDNLQLDVGKTIKMLQNIPGYLTNLLMYPYANDIIKSLVHKFKVILITDRDVEHSRWTEEWLFTNKIYYHKIYYTNGNPKYKVDPTVKLLIEDKFEHVRDYLKNTNGIAIMPIRPWNKNKYGDLQTNYPDRFYSAKGWLHIGALIEQLQIDRRLI